MRWWWVGVWLASAGCVRANPVFGLELGGGDGSGSTALETTGDTTDDTTAAPGTGAASATATSTPVGTTAETGADTTGADTTGADTTPPGTSTEGSSDTEPIDLCGNGVLDPGEACDPAIEPADPKDACLPTCEEIPEKRIVVVGPVLGNFAALFSLADLDAFCTDEANNDVPGVFKAMLSDGATRWAAKAAYDPTDSQDWVLAPHTAYLNAAGETVWVTEDVPLLGVVDGAAAPLLAPLTALPFPVWTGLANDWTTADTCKQWKVGEGSGTVGRTDLVLGFLDDDSVFACNLPLAVVCVQQ